MDEDWSFNPLNQKGAIMMVITPIYVIIGLTLIVIIVAFMLARTFWRRP